jgi:serine/threonine protein kinase
VRNQLEKHGYAKGKRFLKKNVVFKCTHKVSNTEYVCKVQTVKDINEKPMEAQVFAIIKANSLKSLATMHELLDLGIIDNKKTFVEVVDYLSPDKGWSNLDDFKKEYPEKLNNAAILVIFKQIIEGVVRLFEHGITHSDLKGISRLF